MSGPGAAPERAGEPPRGRNISSQDLEIVLVVAAAENGVIGRDNAIPWRLKADMQRFRRLTMGKPVVMGRKTFQSLPKPLVGRTNIVLTRDPGFQNESALVTTSFEGAYDAAIGDALRRFATEIVVIGGAELYAQWMHRADRIEMTQVHAAIEGDARFLPDLSDWDVTARVRNGREEGDTADFSFVTFRRRRQ